MPAPRSPVASHPVRILVGVVLACALGGWLSHRFTAEALRDANPETERRIAVLELGALSSLVQRAGGDEEALAKAVQKWQGKAHGVAQTRVVLTAGARLAASTAPDDRGEKAAP